MGAISHYPQCSWHTVNSVIFLNAWTALVHTLQVSWCVHKSWTCTEYPWVDSFTWKGGSTDQGHLRGAHSLVSALPVGMVVNIWKGLLLLGNLFHVNFFFPQGIPACFWGFWTQFWSMYSGAVTCPVLLLHTAVQMEFRSGKQAVFLRNLSAIAWSSYWATPDKVPAW